MYNISRYIFTFLIFSSSLCYIYGHVALTYPPARKYDLDFLDNSRTKGPCGMPKGNIKTTILAGSAFNVTWHLAYAHRGGFKLQVLDNLQRPVLDLTPVTADSEFVKNDVTSQSYAVKLPSDFTCNDCTIRLLRQASEWGNNYRFWSCSDVDIVPRTQFKEDCSGHGRHLLSKCRCDRLYYGSRCQYRDECVDDGDCGERGKCVDIKSTTAPRLQCYCEIGWFGPGCKQRSPVKTPEVNHAQYSKRRLSPTMILYWRILKEAEEIEIALVANGTSYVALGWRPRSLSASCKHFPFLSDASDSQQNNASIENSKPEPPPSSEPTIAEPESTTEPEILAHAEPTSELEIDKAVPEPTHDVSKTVPEPSSEPNNEPESSSEPPPTLSSTTETITSSVKPFRATRKSTRLPGTIASRQTTEKRATPLRLQRTSEIRNGKSLFESLKQDRQRRSPTETIKTGVRYATSKETNVKAEPASEPEPVSELEPVSEPEPASEAEPESIAKSEGTSNLISKAKPKTLIEQETEEVKPEQETKEARNLEPAAEPTKESKNVTNAENVQTDVRSHPYTPKHDFNAMDCTDIVIGMARGTASRVWDYYTRDRSTPRFDTFWGGKNDLTAALGFEKDGVTTIIFRKKLKATEPTDHSILQEPMHVIWAQGQELGKYKHSPKSGLEVDTASVPDFYRPDELKYHGHGSQRGSTVLNFFEEETTAVDGNNKEIDAETSVPQSKGYKFDECGGGYWQFPRDCDISKNNCEYHASWKVVRNDVMFTILTNHTDLWTGIAFSNNERMAQTDAILGWVDRAGRPFVMDTWLGSYQAPLLDHEQNVRNLSGSIVEGITKISFIRPIITGDNKDVALNGKSCPYFMFPIKGGKFNSVNKKIWKHDDVPVISLQRVCVRACTKGETTTTPAPPPSLQYGAEIRLLRLGEGFVIPKQGTTDFKDLSNSVTSALSADILGKVPGFNEILVREFKKDAEQDSVIAELAVRVDKEAYENSVKSKENSNSVEYALQDIVSRGKAGALQLDPSYLKMQPPQIASISGEDEGRGKGVNAWLTLSSTKLYILIGCIAALVLIALIQAICTIAMRVSKSHNSSVHNKERLIPTSAWKDYNAANTNYAYDSNETKQAPMPLQAVRPSSKVPLQQESRLHQQQNRGYNSNPYGVPRNTYSLPRTVIQDRNGPPPPGPGYYTHDRRTVHQYNSPAVNGNAGGLQPDFYFMPSQRKYSGEVVRVYVDYNKAPK